MTDVALCRLHTALGDEQQCPRGWCAFWDIDRCGLERTGLDFDADPSLARHLLDLRKRLEQQRDLEHAKLALDDIGRLAPPDVSGA